MTRLNKILLVVNIAAVAALVLVMTVYAWTGPSASPPTGGGAYTAASSAPAGSVNVNASGNVTAGTINSQTITSAASFTGTISAASTITGTTINGTTGINTGAGAGTQRIDANGALANITTIATSGTITVGSGSGKIDVGTVDPVYTIGGARYATYLPGMTGVREETTGVAVLRLSPAGRYEYAIDFSTIERGSDLWLFWQTTDFGADWERLSVLLSPAFEGKAWYRKDQGGKRLVFYADTAGEVSYRLTAARFDHAEWLSTSDAGHEGFVLDEK